MSPIASERIDWDTVKRRLPELQAGLEQADVVGEARLREIRRDRAVRLAARHTNASEQSDSLPLLVVRLGDETYGIELKHVVRVLPQPIVTPLPGAAFPLLGIANLHGEVRSVLNLRRLLGLPDGETNDDGYVLLLRRLGGIVGLQVERLAEVRHFSSPELTAPDDDANNRLLRYVSGVTPDKVIVLDVAALLDSAAAPALVTVPD